MAEGTAEAGLFIHDRSWSGRAYGALRVHFSVGRKRISGICSAVYTFQLQEYSALQISKWSHDIVAAKLCGSDGHRAQNRNPLYRLTNQARLLEFLRGEFRPLR